MIFTRPAGAVMIFTRSRNAAASDNSMYCMIPDPFPSSAFGKGSATPDYVCCSALLQNLVRNSEETQCLEEISRGKCQCSLSSSSNC